eukprot:gene323-3262_t
MPAEWIPREPARGFPTDARDRHQPVRVRVLRCQTFSVAVTREHREYYS